MADISDEFPREVCNSMELEDEEDDDCQASDPWDDWNSDDEQGSVSSFLCFFCHLNYSSCSLLFEHCISSHHFDFHGSRKALGLDFYGSIKLINYVRAQVAENRCWCCGLLCPSKLDLHNHMHDPRSFDDIKPFLNDDKYLKPFLQNDSLLYSFDEDEVGEEEFQALDGNVESAGDIKYVGQLGLDDESIDGELAFNITVPDTIGSINSASTSFSHLDAASSDMELKNAMESEHLVPYKIIEQDKKLRVSFESLALKNAKNSNQSYFGAYSSFGIHREMLSDKVRMEAYSKAILQNPSLLNNAVVMDVGCGSGILSLFAAKAGASKVIAVEASIKMAKVATQIAKDNGLWRNGSQDEDGVVEVVQGMVEELDKSTQIQPQSVDVLVSEWMGYCLLYESMLSSVLFARDRWLKPGGAILPDTASIFVAGFGKGGTSVPFWENVYGFDMSCIGKELVSDAAKIPIVDFMDAQDIVTNAAILHTFDLVGMKADEVDFTACTELEPSPSSNGRELESKMWCHGVVLWFETGFTSRFCREMATTLSTSPFTPRTHWAQTILTFREPIALSLQSSSNSGSEHVGTDGCPAHKIHLRISIARAAKHRSVDISLEAVGVGSDGKKRSFPVQLFNLD